MKQFFLLALLLTGTSAFAQYSMPSFLEGTWQIVGTPKYEHWDKLNDQSMKGISYEIKDGIMSTSEYLDISRKDKDLIYTATVVEQNEGSGVAFRMTKSDSVFVFENPSHSFPKKIVYQKLSDWEMLAELSSSDVKKMSFHMIRVGATAKQPAKAAANPNYDSVLAKRLDGNEYGMKGYVLVILKTAPNQSTDRAMISTAFRGHMENMERLVQDGKLIVAGPMEKNSRNYRGIFILNNVGNLEKAKELLQTDPAISAGLLEPEVYNWYGSAALPEYLKAADKIWKMKP